MEKRALIAVVLSLLVLLGAQYFFARRVPQQQAPAPAKQEEKKLPAEQPKPGEVAQRPLPRTEAAPEKVVKVETPLYIAEFSSKGAALNRWELKQYADTNGVPINLVKPTLDIEPLSLGKDASLNLRSAIFDVVGNDMKLSEKNPEGILTFVYGAKDFSIKRTLRFFADSYKVEINDEMSGLPDYWMTPGPELGITDRGGAGIHIGPVILQDSDRIEIDKNNIEGVGFIPRIWRSITGVKGKSEVIFKDNIIWVAQEDKYFFTSIVPLPNASESKAWKNDQMGGMVALHLKGGVNKSIFYAGPKNIDQLKPLNLGLEHIVDFGLFSVIARPIFWLLKWINGFVGNWGWSIILLTIIIRIPFIPLLNKGQKSMKKLQELQPKMNEIKERFKKDPQRMQREMMELYRKYKVNPMGGCLPILIQIPVFFALYKVLLIAIELRGAPWMFWLHDLSQKDPYYVLPIIMGITMLVQQKMTPSSADPTQQKIMMFMPIVFTFMFLNFASGLVLYWLMSNLLSIGQQYFVNKALAKEKASAA